MTVVQVREPVSVERSASNATAGASSRPAIGYRTFSRTLAPSLTAGGGALLVAGGLGLHLRATRRLIEGAGAEVVLRSYGYASRTGWLIAIVGAVTLVASLGWLARSRLATAAPVAAAAAGIGLVVWRLRVLDARAAGLVARERPSPEFVEFHAGFGWGAWLMLVGAVVVGIGVLAGLLRELDLRREARS